MRVLDMGCGKAISSIFLAKEYGVQVWANDLWIDATENWSRIQEADMGERVFPIHAEAHALPYADGFFDAIVSMDAYHYFGTDDLYIGTMARYLKPGGQLGIVVPGLSAEIGELPPEHLRPFWEWDFASFHSPQWWRTLWQRSGKVRVESADMLPDGWREWLCWLDVCADCRLPRLRQKRRRCCASTLDERLVFHALWRANHDASSDYNLYDFQSTGRPRRRQ